MSTLIDLINDVKDGAIDLHSESFETGRKNASGNEIMTTRYTKNFTDTGKVGKRGNKLLKAKKNAKWLEGNEVDSVTIPSAIRNLLGIEASTLRFIKADNPDIGDVLKAIRAKISLTLLLTKAVNLRERAEKSMANPMVKYTENDVKAFLGMLEGEVESIKNTLLRNKTEKVSTVF